MMRKPVAADEWIARSDLLCRDADGAEFQVAIFIGRPYTTDDGGSACPVEVAGLHGRCSDIVGVDTLQALCLALSFVRTLLEGFVEKGGKILDPEDGTEWTANDFAALFGKLRR